MLFRDPDTTHVYTKLMSFSSCMCDIRESRVKDSCSFKESRVQNSVLWSSTETSRWKRTGRTLCFEGEGGVPVRSSVGHDPSSHARQVYSSNTNSFSLQGVHVQQQLTSPFRITWGSQKRRSYISNWFSRCFIVRPNFVLCGPPKKYLLFYLNQKQTQLYNVYG